MVRRRHVLDLFHEGALSSYPDKVGFRCEEEALTFQQAKSVALMLTGEVKGFLNSDASGPIVIIGFRNLTTIVSVLTSLYSNRAFTVVDPKGPIDRMARLLINLDPCLLLVDVNCESKVVELTQKYPHFFLTSSHLDPNKSADLVCEETDSNHRDDLPVCIYNTSGSTGFPKSVVISHGAVIDFVEWVSDEFDFGPSDVLGSITPFHFDHFTLDFFITLMTGAEMVIIPDRLTSFPIPLLEHVANSEATFLFWVPSLMVSIANSGALSAIRIPTLRRVFFAGEVFPMPQLRAWIQNYRDVEFVNLYGPTEATTDCIYYRLNGTVRENGSIPIGVPRRNVGFFILNDKNEQVTSSGEIGELFLAGRCLALGYFGNTEATELAFVQNPLNNKYRELLYRTGDLVRLGDDGLIYFVGRKDTQIKHSGYRIELGEIESALSRIEGISNAIVTYNQGTKEITACIESMHGEQLSRKKVISGLANLVPKYMYPHTVAVFKKFPLTQSGKLDRRSILSQLRQES